MIDKGMHAYTKEWYTKSNSQAGSIIIKKLEKNRKAGKFEKVKEERESAASQKRNYFIFKHRLHSGEIMPATESYWIDIYGDVALSGIPTTEEALHELMQHAGSQFDPEIVRIFTNG